MTVITQDNRIEHEGTGSQTSFVYDYRVDLMDHMSVWIDKIETPSGWSITGLENPTGGNVIFDDPPADGAFIVLMRIVDITQGMDYQPYDPFPAKSHEQALDWLTFICQQLQEELNRKYGSPPGGGEGGDFIMPDPEAGKVLAWREDEAGLENQPGIGTFIQLVEDAEAAAAASAASAGQAAGHQGWAFLWAQEDVDVPIDDGVHPPGFSAYHWATKAEEGGIIDIFSEDEQMMVVNIPEPRYRSLEMLTGTPGAMVKLDHQGLVPLENMPFTGNLRFIHLYEGHDRCPKYQYEVPDETPCVDPDYRNPSERIPSIDWDGGDYFVIVQCDEEPLLNQINLINPATGLYEVTDVANGDAILWLEGDEGLAEPGWYLYPGFATDSVLAENVIFDDTNTDIKGITVQEWNQAADAVIQDKVDQSGDLMTGSLEFMNEIGIQGYMNDATTLINLLHLNADDSIRLGSSAAHTGVTRLYTGNQEYIRLDQADNQIQALRNIRLNNNQEIAIRNGADTEDVRLMHMSINDHINLGGIVNQPVSSNVFIYQGNSQAIVISNTLITFLRPVVFDDIQLPNNGSLSWRNAADTEDVELMRLNLSNNVHMGGGINHPAGSSVSISQGGASAIVISTDGVRIQGTARHVYFPRFLYMANAQAILFRNAADTADINTVNVGATDDVILGGVSGHPDTSLVRIYQGSAPAIDIANDEMRTYGPRPLWLGSSLNLGNNQYIRGRNVANTTSYGLLEVTAGDNVRMGGVSNAPTTSDTQIYQGGTQAIEITVDVINFWRPTNPLRSEVAGLSGIEAVNLNLGDQIRLSLDDTTILHFENAPDTGERKLIIETNGHVVSMPVGLLWESGVVPAMDSDVWMVTLTFDGGLCLAEAKQFS